MKSQPYPDPVLVWRCPWCVWLIEAATVADRYDHVLDEHLPLLKKASAQTLNLIVSPR